MTKSKVGRPRSEKSRAAIIRATHALLHENGVGGLTLEAIAKRAGVGRPTLYRWWPSLADIVLEVLLVQAEAEISVKSGESLRETLQHFLRQSMRAINEGAGVHLRFLMAHAQQDEGFRSRFRDCFTAERRRVLRSILERGAGDGHAGTHDPDMLVDLVFGAMWYRLLLNHSPMDEAFADELTETVMTLLSSGRDAQG